MKHALVLLGSAFLLAGIASFLVPTIPHWGTLLMIVVGAGGAAYGAWFGKR